MRAKLLRKVRQQVRLYRPYRNFFVVSMPKTVYTLLFGIRITVPFMVDTIKIPERAPLYGHPLMKNVSAFDVYRNKVLQRAREIYGERRCRRRGLRKSLKNRIR